MRMISLLLLLACLCPAAFAQRGGGGSSGPTTLSISDIEPSFGSGGTVEFTWTDAGAGGTGSASYYVGVDLYAWNETTSEWDAIGSSQDDITGDYYNEFTVAPSGGANHGISVTVNSMGLAPNTLYNAVFWWYALPHSGDGFASVNWGWYDPEDPNPTYPPPELEVPLGPPGGYGPPYDYPLAPPSGPAGPGSFQSSIFTP